MGWNPDYLYKIRGTWAKQRDEQIIVFNLINAVPAVLINQEQEENHRKRRVELCPEEWSDDFGEEFYEHTLENGFYYLTPYTEWKAQSQSVPAPGIEQFKTPSTDDLQLQIDLLKRGADSTDE